MNKRAIFLDRDGVINQAIVRNGKAYPPASIEEVVITDGALEGLTSLKNSGYVLLVATNQPDVARGKLTREIVEEINAYLMEQLPLDRIYTCYHDDADRCECRKPLPGLILRGALEWGVDPSQSFLIGDRYKDIEAGRISGCTTILIGGSYSEAATTKPDYVVKDLITAVKIIEKTG
jgi:D-glycero-D-manno-heptose 1,7-bisphosphate phosphatase